jgi:tRNA-specific 2-thiouridylase
MSGGVDSSVAAALLKKQGFNVLGVFMKQWSPTGRNRPCIWKQERDDALRAAMALNIPFKTWDFSKQYEKNVVSYMIREYRAGRTPNPDVMCNKEIKFGLFFKKAMAEGADYVATGHYVIAKNGKLYQGEDKNKDQSYFLWTLGEEQVERCLFPVGDITKPEVRKLALKFNLPNAKKKDSQGVCFIGPLDVRQFLKQYIKQRKGNIMLRGNVIGKHDGIYYYTIGQRHGLDIKLGGGPYFVINKDIKKNIIYVGGESELLGSKCMIERISWVNDAPTFPANIDVKIRYRTKSVKAILSGNGDLKFLKPTIAITSGQSAVFYRGQRLLGGGIIK